MTAAPLDTDLMLGRALGNYRIIEKIGAGGMGAVYSAEHLLLGKKAAIKVLLPERCTSAEIVDRFFNEAKASSLIRHPGIVDIFDYGRLDDGNAYIVMELLEGETLGERLRREEILRPHAAAAIARHVAGALGAAHGHGIVHRDLKPDNVFMVADPTQPRGERAKLLDFGICKLQTTTSDLVKTDTGRLMGTPYYMSPEQCRGAGKVDHRTDIYSLGCVLFQMLTGRPPFVLEGAGEILAAHIYERPLPPSTYQATVPPALERLVMRLIEKDPALRFPNMDAVAVALNEAVVQFAGDEPSEPSLATSDHFRTNRVPRVGFTDDAPTVTATTAYAELSVARPGRLRRWVLPAAAVAAVGLGVAIAMVTREPRDQAVTPAAPVVAAPAAAPAPPEPDVRPLPVEATRAVPEGMVTLRIDSVPSGAQVFRVADGVRVGNTPVELFVQRGPGEAELILKKRGHHTERVSLPVDGDRAVKVELKPRRSGEPETLDLGVGPRAPGQAEPPGPGPAEAGAEADDEDADEDADAEAPADPAPVAPPGPAAPTVKPAPNDAPR